MLDVSRLVILIIVSVLCSPLGYLLQMWWLLEKPVERK